MIRCLAKKTILATGGLGQIFLRTTNPAGARGDGVAMAYRAGARVINTEFIQFHPTTFYHPHEPNALISEAVRGAGARLVRANGEPFMQEYSPDWKDLAPRDVVSRSIHNEMLKTDVPHVYLDLRDPTYPLTASGSSFPNIYRDRAEVRRGHQHRVGSGGAGGPLLLRWRLGRRVGPDHDQRPLCGGGGVLHGPPRGQSPGEHLPPGRIGVGKAGRRGHRQ